MRSEVVEAVAVGVGREDSCLERKEVLINKVIKGFVEVIQTCGHLSETTVQIIQQLSMPVPLELHFINMIPHPSKGTLNHMGITIDWQSILITKDQNKNLNKRKQEPD